MNVSVTTAICSGPYVAMKRIKIFYTIITKSDGIMRITVIEIRP